MSGAPPRLRAVVVDDTPDLRALLCLALENSGEIEVVGEAGNGVEALDRVRATEPDIVLLDLAMPVMDGLEALPHIRSLCPDAAVVVLSGFGAGAMTAQAIEAGADGYLQKGASAGAIVDYVRTLAGRPSPAIALPRPVAPEVVSGLATELAPIGVVVAKGDDWLTIVSANPRAVSLLGTQLTPGNTLATAMPELADAVQRLTLSDTADVSLGDPARTLNVSVRRAEGLVLVYVAPVSGSDESDLLRRAIATTAHEIRNPVTVLVGVADTLRDRGDALTEDQLARLRGAVVRQARMLDSITSDLLTAAEAHRGTLRIDLTRVDVKEVLEAVVDGADDVHVRSDEPCAVLADALRFEQMLTNLIGNARKYAEPPIEVHVIPRGRSVVIRVCDRGDGVPEDFRSMLFDEFTRATDARARGTGLGLYVVRSLAEAQGGSVSYEPRVDGGSVFSVRLPAAD